MDNKTNTEKIDLLEIITLLWQQKKLFSITIGIAAIIGIIISFSIPKSYESQVILAPEVSSATSLGGNLNEIASMVGVNINAGSSDVDAFYPEIYPQITNSLPFIINISKTKVSKEDQTIKNITLYDYQKKYIKYPWWNKIIGIFEFPEQENPSNKKEEININAFHLRKEQENILSNIRNSILCNVDKKTNLITIKVTTQDPLISATLADKVQIELQKYITNYRTKKAKNDLYYLLKLQNQAKSQYERARRKYGHTVDSNLDVVYESAKSDQDELENDMQLKYNAYTQIAQQVQIARAKVQERTPVFTQIQPATVPLKKSAPKRITIVLGLILLDIFCTSFYIIIKNSKKV